MALSVVKEFLVFVCQTRIIKSTDNTISQLDSILCVEGNVPGPDEVGIEAGETVPGGADRHIGEIHHRDRQGVDGGRDGTCGPAREGLLDQDSGHAEASQDNERPEQFEESSVVRNVG